MDNTPSKVAASLSPSVGLELDRVCNRFERAWKAGERPRIEDFLAGHEDAERGILLRELVALEVFHRRRLGETPSDEEYRDRFPELAVSPMAETMATPDDRSHSEGTWIGEGNRDSFLP